MMPKARKPPLSRPIEIEKGGIEAQPKQPLGRAPLRETYGARSGEAPEKAGTPRAIASAKSKPRKA